MDNKKYPYDKINHLNKLLEQKQNEETKIELTPELLIHFKNYAKYLDELCLNRNKPNEKYLDELCLNKNKLNEKYLDKLWKNIWMNYV